MSADAERSHGKRKTQRLAPGGSMLTLHTVSASAVIAYSQSAFLHDFLISVDKAKSHKMQNSVKAHLPEPPVTEVE